MKYKLTKFQAMRSGLVLSCISAPVVGLLLGSIATLAQYLFWPSFAFFTACMFCYHIGHTKGYIKANTDGIVSISDE